MNFLSHRLLFIIGVVVVLMPFLGFPALWKSVFYVLIGSYVTFLSFSMKGAKRSPGKAWVLRREKAFVENSPTTGVKKRVVRKKLKEESVTPAVSPSEATQSVMTDIQPPATQGEQNGTLHGA